MCFIIPQCDCFPILLTQIALGFFFFIKHIIIFFLDKGHRFLEVCFPSTLYVISYQYDFFLIYIYVYTYIYFAIENDSMSQIPWCSCLGIVAP